MHIICIVTIIRCTYIYMYVYICALRKTGISSSKVIPRKLPFFPCLPRLAALLEMFGGHVFLEMSREM